MDSNPVEHPGGSVDVEMEDPVAPSSSATSEAASDKPRASSVPMHRPGHTVGFCYSTEMLAHFHPHGHPETPERIVTIMDGLTATRLREQMKRVHIRPVEKLEALLVHSEDHWEKVMALQYLTDQQRVDSEQFYEQLSLYVMAGTTYSARLSCGGVIECCLAVARGELRRSFAVVRPPGHHAEPDEHMGFCFFNNVAVATRVVQQLTPIKKVLILDWDVHHGNGTQRAFNDDPNVLYISIHRYEGGRFYPCTKFGALDSCGEGAGLGFSVNVPWPSAKMGDADYIHAFQKVIMPIAMEFAPELVIISAGFDAADGDELGECLVTPAGYAHMTHMLCGLANGRVVVALEGGYNIDSVRNSSLAVTRVLLGEPPEELPGMVAGEAATETVFLVAREQSKYWKNIDVKACEPREEQDPLSVSIPEILKAHRQRFLADQYDLMEVPLFDAMEQFYSSQVMCTPDMLTTNTLVVLIHDFGNLQAELASASTCDLGLENSYLVDFSRALIAWVTEEKYGLLDVNIYPKPSFNGDTRNAKAGAQTGDLATYLWDNYVGISEASNIFLIGHGPGCQHLVQLLNQRAVSVMTNVKRIMQVVGAGHIPAVPRYPEELRNWYRQNSVVFTTADHYAFEEPRKALKRYGNLSPIDERKPIKLIMKALPAMKIHVKEALLPSAIPIPST